MNPTLERLRPEVMVGGFARDDGLVSFYQRIHALLRPDMTVVDLGCGRGEVFDSDQGYRSKIARLQGHVAKLIGIDVDRAILDHPALDERHVIEVGEPLPLATGSVDLLMCDWVLEHIADPPGFVSEIERVLKPNGWFCARTPNRWGYAGLAAQAVPSSAHVKLLAWLWPGRQERDVFPTTYRMNSLAAIRRYFPRESWQNYSFTQSTTPKYYGRSAMIFRLIDFYQRLAPGAMQTNLLVFLQKRR